MLRKLGLIFLILLLASVCFSDDRFQQPGPVALSRDDEKWTEKTLRKLSLEEKIGQMFMLRANTQFLNLASPEYLQLRATVQRYHIGALLLTVPAEGAYLLKSQPYEAAMFTNQLQRESHLPLIFAADFERGLAMRFTGATGFPAAMAFGAVGKPAYVESFARIVAQEARAIGVQWNFFPVADINSVPANPIINTRAFGEDPRQVKSLVEAYLQGAREAGMLTTAKHFPGHGDVDTDSHLGVARVFADRAHLDAFELPPFRAAIEAGVDAVMVAHVTVPALEPDPNRVATVSRAVVTGLLKEQLGFQGLVVTDALDMNAITRLLPPGRAVVEAVKAGVDMLVIPADIDASYNALLNAVRSGEVSESRIDASVGRILRAKAAVGLHKARLVDSNALSTLIARPENLAFAQQVANEAVTLVRDNRQLLPLKRNGTARPSRAYQQAEEAGNRLVAVVFSDDMRSESGRVFEHELRARVPDANVIFVDPRTASGMAEQVLAAVEHAQAVVAAAISVPSAGKMLRVQGALTNTVSLDDASTALLRRLLERAPHQAVVVALGNPYLAAGFPGVENYLCTYSNASVSEMSAVKALFGEIPIRGRLPVTIPGIAERGAGLDRPAQ